MVYTRDTQSRKKSSAHLRGVLLNWRCNKRVQKCSESNYANENLWNEHVSAAGAFDASSDGVRGAQVMRILAAT